MLQLAVNQGFLAFLLLFLVCLLLTSMPLLDVASNILLLQSETKESIFCWSIPCRSEEAISVKRLSKSRIALAYTFPYALFFHFVRLLAVNNSISTKRIKIQFLMLFFHFVRLLAVRSGSLVQECLLSLLKVLLIKSTLKTLWTSLNTKLQSYQHEWTTRVTIYNNRRQK